ncbi:hypothetical protein PV772_15930 [Pseudarthrobacter sp. CC12]
MVTNVIEVSIRSPQLFYGSAEESLQEQLLPSYIRDIAGRAANWCIK